MTLISYGHNVLLTETKGNFKKTAELITNSQQSLDRIGLIKPDVLIQANILKPFSTSYLAKYQINVNLIGISLNATREAKAMEKEMIKITRMLDVNVQHVYDEDTPEYKVVFVKGRSTNYEGLPVGTQIQNYHSISMNMGTLPDLATLKTAYDLKIDLFEKKVKFSADSKTDLEEQSALLETARILWCEEGYAVIAGLMIIYKKTPERVGDFFDLSIFNTRQSHIDPDKDAIVVPLAIGALVVFGGVYDSSKTFQIHNCGFGNVEVGSMPAFDSLIIPEPLTWLPDELKIVTGLEMGDLLNRFLGFKSEDVDLPGEIKIKEVIPV